MTDANRASVQFHVFIAGAGAPGIVTAASLHVRGAFTRRRPTLLDERPT